MRELAILTFVTLDGVMQAPNMPEEDTSGGFEKGGWARNCWDDVMEQVQREAMASPYDMLFGRKTYELFAAHWPSVHDGDPVARMVNNVTKYVATTTLTDLKWKNSRPIAGDIAGEVSRLKDQDGPLLQIHGSWQLIQTLLFFFNHAAATEIYTGVALPNEASEALHRKLGYRRLGVLTEVGRKFDRYWDVAWYEKCLGAD